MRAGGCAAQQTLSAEAASVLKHSLSLSRRRGHAQVTPLHVAATLLSSRSSLLRRACLKSQPHQASHPLQCRALELCFNVALNRLPAAPGPLLHAQPSLSNALIAALKRAQAHQRRGSIEQHQQQHQQPLIAIKVELDQLILSILDDPSVSRVMREAGFSSTAVKNNLEDCTSSVFHCYTTAGSGGIYSTPNSPQRPAILNPTTFFHSQNPFLFSPQKKPTDLVIKDDIKVVLQVLLGKKRRNTVIVGDSLSMAETLVAEVMHMVEKGEVPEELKSAQLIKFQFSSVPLMLMSKDEVDSNVLDLKRKVERLGSSGRVIVYIGDLKWAVERESEEREDECSGYSPIDHLIAEIGKLVSWYNTSSMRVWFIATANYQTYIKCQMKQPPLDLQWALQPVSVPSGGLGLSLNATSGRDSRTSMSENSSPDKKVLCLKEELGDGLTCCPECISSYEKEAASSQLPYWLKSHTNTTLHKEDLDELKRKYNKLCQNVHQGGQDPHNLSSVMSNQSYLGRNHYYASSYPCWPTKNNIFADPETISFARPPNQTASSLPRFRRQQSCHIEFSFSNGASKNQSEEPNLDSLKEMEDKEVKITLALGNSTYIDAKRRDKVGVDVDLCKENVPWQLDTIPLIIEAISRDRFVLIQGNDVIGKRRIGVAIAESMFGSSDLFECMNVRKNQETGIHNQEMVEKALRNHERVVLLIEDVDFADHEFTKFLVECFEGREKRDSGNAIFILTMDGDTSEDINSVIPMKLVVQEIHDHKRKADWDYPMRAKSSKNGQTDEVSSNTKRSEFKSSNGGLDLNVRADEDSSLTFLKKIDNSFVLSKSRDQEKRAKEMFLSKLTRAFEEGSGWKSVVDFKVDERVLEEVLKGAGLYLNSLFEEWLKDIFRTSIDGVNRGERGVSVRLCLEGKGENGAKEGFMGTCLPKRIPVSFIG